MAQASAKYLPHFAADGHGRLRIVEAERAARPPGERPLAEIVAEAEAHGRRAAAEAAKAEGERQRAADRAAFAAELAEARRRWSEEMAGRLAAEIGARLDELRATVVDGVARVLAPFVETLVRERALDELGQTVAALLRDGRHLRIRLSGPADLLAVLAERLDVPAIECVAADGPDVAVILDDTTVETRIAAWLSVVATAVAGNDDG